MGDYPAVPQTTWDPLDIVGLYPTTLLENDAGVEGLIVCTVTKDCDGTLVTDLVEADFTILASDGVEGEASDSLLIELPKKGNPKLDSQLNQMVSAQNELRVFRRQRNEVPSGNVG